MSKINFSPGFDTTRYTTDDLVEWVMGEISTTPYITPIVTHSSAVVNRGMLCAIIARLRAADKLCARDKEMVIKVTGGTGITLGEMAEWVEAIAEYGEGR